MKLNNATRLLNYPFIKLNHFISGVILFDRADKLNEQPANLTWTGGNFIALKTTGYNERVMFKMGDNNFEF